MHIFHRNQNKLQLKNYKYQISKSYIHSIQNQLKLFPNYFLTENLKVINHYDKILMFVFVIIIIYIINIYLTHF